MNPTPEQPLSSPDGTQAFKVLRPHLLDLAVRDSLLDCQARQLRPKTLRLYRESLGCFVAFVKS